jgi:hypothetical protein
VCQPDDDDISLELVANFMSGNGFNFLTKTGKGTLHPVAFGGRRARGNEKYLHSYLGEAFCGDYAMNKFRHMCWGRRFVWVTDCYAVKFILSYDGANQAILRLQMRLMGWDVDIVHRRNEHLVDADYWSRLDSDLFYDPTFRTYLHLTEHFRRTNPPPSEIPMDEEHICLTIEAPVFTNQGLQIRDRPLATRSTMNHQARRPIVPTLPAQI